MTTRRSPVFVDDSGRRRTLTRRTGRLLVVAFAGYVGLLGAGFARNPHLGPLVLPTFGVSGIVRGPQAPATVLGEATTRSAAADGSAGPAEDPSKSAAPADASRPGGSGSGPSAGGATKAGVTGPGGTSSQPGNAPSRPAPGQPADAPAAPPTTASTAPPPVDRKSVV